jgi:hypothetical protein
LQLARHGVHLHVDRVTSNGSPIAEVILARAVRNGSDLLVFGAYGHSRLRELLLGGRRSLGGSNGVGHKAKLACEMPVPVLVSI